MMNEGQQKHTATIKDEKSIAPLPFTIRETLMQLKDARTLRIIDVLNQKINALNDKLHRTQANTCIVELTGELSSFVTFGIVVAAAKAAGSPLTSVIPIYVDTPALTTEAFKRMKHVSYIYGRDIVKIPFNSVFRTVKKELNLSMQMVGGQDVTLPLANNLKSSSLQYVKGLLNQSDKTALLVSHQSLMDKFTAGALNTTAQPFDVRALVDMMPFEISALAGALGLPDCIISGEDSAPNTNMAPWLLECFELWAITQTFSKEKIAQVMQRWSKEDCAYFNNLTQYCYWQYRLCLLNFEAQPATIL